MLVHSRFLATDRLQREREIVDLLGPNGRRPRRLVVVATQVIEQSLDVDFDVMVSDIAPIDSLLQRMGRLHRHNRPPAERPSSLRTPRFFVTGVERPNANQAPIINPGARRIYGEAVLLRTIIVLASHHARSPTVASPDDVAHLVADTYDPQLTPSADWADRWQAAEQQQRERELDRQQRAEQGTVAPPKKGSQVLFGWSDQANEDKARAAAVRDIAESLEVIAVVRHPDGTCRTPSWIPNHPDEVVNTFLGIDDDLAQSVATCTVQLPAWIMGNRTEQFIAELEQNGFPEWQDSRWLRGELPLIFDMDENSQPDTLIATVLDYTLTYHPHLGLTVSQGGK